MVTHASYDQPPQQLESFLADLPIGPYPVFGIALEDAAKLNDQFDDSSIFTPSYNKWENQLCLPEYHKYLPRFLLTCIKFVNDYGLQEEGLYRVSGSGQQVRELRDSFIEHGPNYEIPPTTDVHAITSLIKNFLRELPDLILPVTTCHTFLAYVKSELPTSLSFSNGSPNFSLFTAAEEDLNPYVIPTQILQEILQSQLPPNFALVQLLTRHFATVVQNQSHNRMSLTALALILCPTIKIHKSVFHALILKSERIWTDLHPRQSEVAARGVKYDTRNILAYRQDDEMAVSFSTASSSASLTDDTTVTSMDPISYDLFTSSLSASSMLDMAAANKQDQRRTSVMLRPASIVEDDYFETGAISFSSMDYSGQLKSGSESVTSMPSLKSKTLQSQSPTNRFSDFMDYTDYKLAYPHEYKYRQNTNHPEGPSSANTRYSPNRSVSSGPPSANRRVFLRKSVANF